MIARDIKHSTIPAYVMSVPFTMATDEPNNAIMMELSAEERVVDKRKAIGQWLDLYRFLASRGLVYLLPSKEGLQDQPYVANLGIVPPHLETNVAVIANYRTEVRRGETPVGADFFRTLGFDTVVAPEFFEGEADLKYIRDNIYIGAHGMRTSLSALDWLRDTYDMRIIPLRIRDEYLFHLDCVVFPLTPDKVVLCTGVCDDTTVAQIENVAEIIDVDRELARAGITNAVRCGSYVLCDSSVDKMELADDRYALERRKLENLARICIGNGLGPAIFDLSEFDKSGAALSCLVMHLNLASYR